MRVLSFSGTPSAIGEAFGETCRAAIHELYQLRLANAIVAAQPQATASELLATFEAARAALESAAASETASGTSEPALDGPKRRFTWVHALLAAIILALTLWHYLGR